MILRFSTNLYYTGSLGDNILTLLFGYSDIHFLVLFLGLVQIFSTVSLGDNILPLLFGCPDIHFLVRYFPSVPIYSTHIDWVTLP